MIRSILPIIVIGLVLVVGVSYSIAALGSLDENINVTNTSYEDSYNAAQEPAKLTFSMFGFMPIVLIIAALAGVLLWIVKKT